MYSLLGLQLTPPMSIFYDAKNFSKGLTLRKFDETSNCGHAHVRAHETRVSKFYVAINSSHSHTQKVDGIGRQKIRPDKLPPGIKSQNPKPEKMHYVNM